MRYCCVKNCVNNDVSFVIFIHQTWDLEGGGGKLNLCKKFPGKKVSGKKQLEIKTLEKSPNFIKSLEKLSVEIKSGVLDSQDFFPKIVWGLPIKSQEIRSQEKKSLRK